MPRHSPIEQARLWWKKHADADYYVVPPSAAPSAAIARVLRQEGLVMDVAGKRAWILTAQRPIDRRAVFIANYWPVVALVLGRYEPAAVAGLSAVKLHLEDFSPPENLLAYQGANHSEYALAIGRSSRVGHVDHSDNRTSNNSRFVGGIFERIHRWRAPGPALSVW
jgi:hypothetical protein